MGVLPPQSDRPKISIITPSLNQGRYLETCIRSILDQEYANLEYMVIDGGSTDESLSIIKKYEGQINFWVSEKDRGQSDAINKGLKRATGELVAWLNADDFYLPGALQAFADAYIDNPSASFFFGNGHRVDEQGRFISFFFREGKVLFNQQALIYGLNYILQPSTAINRVLLEDVGYLNENLHYVLDTDLWIRLSKIADPVAIQSTIAASREYGETKTSTGSFKRVEEIRCLAEKYSGLSMTPGALCYLLDTLDHLAKQHEDVFPSWYRTELIQFWAKTAALMAQFGANPDGSPIGPGDRDTDREQTNHGITFSRRSLSTLLPRIFRRLVKIVKN